MSTASHSNGSSAPNREIAALLSELMGRIQRGERISVEELKEQHPDELDELKQLLPTLKLLSDTSTDVPGQQLASDTPGVLGDFRLVREIGRGGMGVVYEARQISLDRRVALKLLPFAGVLDQRMIKRFQNEARAAAQLEHEHIVPVFHVGSERGVHYYAMQYVEGNNLSGLIQQLRIAATQGTSASTKQVNREATEAPPHPTEAPPHPTEPPLEPTADAGLGQPDSRIDATRTYTGSRGPVSPTDPVLNNSSQLSRELAYAVAGSGSTSTPEFVKTFVRLGIEVADALQHAHEMGVIHRDIKPSNILLDNHGRAWVADFGLAQIQGDPGLTLTGDFVGTLRYMSPEQALAHRVVVDHRTDIYSLGVTLYELLTLRAAVGGAGRESILRQLAFEEPPTPRKINRRIPAELATIVTKAFAKNPDERYQTAGELADDLRRFQNDEPIKARPPTVPQRIAKWSRRHKVAVASFAALTLVVFLACLVSLVSVSYAYSETKQAHEQEATRRAEVERLLKKANGLRLVAQSSLQLEADPSLALTLAHEGARLHPGLEANNALLAALDANHQLRSLDGHKRPVGAALFSPDGTKVVTTAKPSLVTDEPEPARLWDVESGTELLSMRASMSITSAAFSPRGGRFLTTATGFERGENGSSEDRFGPVQIWETSTGDHRVLQDASLNFAHPSSFSPSGTRVVTSSPDNTARVWDVVDGGELLRLQGHSRRVVHAAFAANGERIVTLSDDNTVRIWRSTDGEEILRIDWWSTREPGADKTTVDSVELSHDGSLLVTGSRKYGIQLWRLTEESVEGPIHSDHWPGSKGFFQPGGRLLAHRRFGDTAVRNLTTGERVARLEGDGHGFSPDGRLFATSAGKSIYLWNVATGQRIAELNGHKAQINHVSFSHDATRVVSSSDDATSKVWHVESGESRAYLAARAERVGYQTELMNRTVLKSPDDGVLLVATAPRTYTTVWDLDADEAVSTVFGKSNETPAGNRIITAARKEAWLWNAESGERIGGFDAGARILHTTMSPDATHAIVPVEGGLAWLWDLESGARHALVGHTESIFQSAFSSDGTRLATASGDGSVRVWDVATSRPTETKLQHEGRVVGVSFSPDGNSLLTVSDRDVAFVWNAETGERTAVLRREGLLIRGATFSIDGRFVVTYHTFRPSNVVCWNATTGEAVRETPGMSGLVKMRVSPAGSQVVLVSTEEGSQAWDYATGEVIEQTQDPTTFGVFSADGERIVTAPDTLRTAPDHVSGAEAASFSHPVIRVWGASTGDSQEQIRITDGLVQSMAIDPHSGHVVVSANRYGVALNDIRARSETANFFGHAAPVAFAAVAGNRCVTASWDQTAIVWDAETGTQLHRLVGHQTAITCGAISPDGSTLATAAADGEVILWEVETGQQRHALQHHTDLVHFCSFDQAGQRLLTGSFDKTLKILDLTSGDVTTHQSLHGIARWAEFSPDGDWRLVIPGGEVARGRDQAGTATRRESAGDEENEFRFAVRVVRGKDTNYLQHDAAPQLARFSPSGEHVLTATSDTLFLWETATGAKTREFHKDGLSVSVALFTPRGDVLMAGGRNELVMWDVASGTELLAISPAGGLSHSGAAAYVTADTITAVLADRRIRTWPADPITAASGRVRPLTGVERSRFQLVPPRD